MGMYDTDDFNTYYNTQKIQSILAFNNQIVEFIFQNETNILIQPGKKYNIFIKFNNLLKKLKNCLKKINLILENKRGSKTPLDTIDYFRKLLNSEKIKDKIKNIENKYLEIKGILDNENFKRHTLYTLD